MSKQDNFRVKFYKHNNGDKRVTGKDIAYDWMFGDGLWRAVSCVENELTLLSMSPMCQE